MSDICVEVKAIYICGNDHLTNNSKQCPCGDIYLVPLQAILERSVYGVSYLDDYTTEEKWFGFDS